MFIVVTAPISPVDRCYLCCLLKCSTYSHRNPLETRAAGKMGVHIVLRLWSMGPQWPMNNHGRQPAHLEFGLSVFVLLSKEIRRAWVTERHFLFPPFLLFLLLSLESKLRAVSTYWTKNDNFNRHKCLLNRTHKQNKTVMAATSGNEKIRRISRFVAMARLWFLLILQTTFLSFLFPYVSCVSCFLIPQNDHRLVILEIYSISGLSLSSCLWSRKYICAVT